jgi:hypothetical protein
MNVSAIWMGWARKSIGQQFALTQVAYTTVLLAQRFKRLGWGYTK